MQVKPLMQSRAESERTASWRRKPMHVWRGRSVSTDDLRLWITMDAAARRREAICCLMDRNGIPNTERDHRHAYALIWTERVRVRLGDPPRPATLVRWRRKRKQARNEAMGEFGTGPTAGPGAAPADRHSGV